MHLILARFADFIKESGAFESTDDNAEELGDFDALVEQLMSELTSKELLGEPFAALSEIVCLLYHICHLQAVSAMVGE